jgi:ureidoglycolate lyase
MKLLRFGRAGEEKPGLLAPDGQMHDLSGVADKIQGGTLSEAAEGSSPRQLHRLGIDGLGIRTQTAIAEFQ